MLSPAELNGQSHVNISDLEDLHSVGVLRSSSLKAKADSCACPCVFSPDGLLLAWAHAPKSVLILPSPSIRHCVCTDVAGTDYSAISDYMFISAGAAVCAMAFGNGRPRMTISRCDRQKQHTNLDAHKKSLVFATGHVNGRVRLWCPYTGQLLLHLMDHQAEVRALQFAPDTSNRLVTVSTDRTIKVWDLNDEGNMFKTMGGCRVPLYRCAWRPDGKQMVTCGLSKLVYVVDMVKYGLSYTLKGHLHEVTSCSYSSDGRIILSSSLDTTAILWDSQLGTALLVLCHLVPEPTRIFASGANGSWVTDATLSADSCQVVTVCEDRKVRVWDVSGDDSSGRIHQPRCCGLVLPRSDADSPTWCTLNQSGTIAAVGTSLSDVHPFNVPSLVPPLKHLARNILRRNIDSNHLKLLPIPQQLRQYLSYGRHL